jgi:glycerate kinase
LVITAEGRVDRQTLLGKGPMGVIEHARKHGVPAIMFAGQVKDAEQLNHVIDALFPITNGPCTLEEALTTTEQDLENTACQIGNLMATLQ